MRIAATSPENAVELLDRAFNEGDLDGVLGLYENDAAVVAEPNRIVRGSMELKTFFEGAIRSGLKAKQLKVRVIEADGVALFLSRWILIANNTGQAAETRTFVATTVFRKQADGTWKALIDNPFGPLILDSE
jgi:ketosteroid isomerase-like protein